MRRALRDEAGDRVAFRHGAAEPGPAGGWQESNVWSDFLDVEVAQRMHSRESGIRRRSWLAPAPRPSSSAALFMVVSFRALGASRLVPTKAGGANIP